jgi:hypothetical protein
MAKTDIYVSYEKNIASVLELIKIYRERTNKQGAKSESNVDILRAAVVFIHSSFESYYRQAVAIGVISRLKSNDMADMDKLKFNVSAKELYKASAVGLPAALDGAVDAELETQSFGSYKRIREYAAHAGFDLKGFPQEKSDVLNAMIQRRHAIVHDADRVKERDKWQKAKEKLSDTDVQGWLAATDDFVHVIETQLPRLQAKTVAKPHNISA